MGLCQRPGAGPSQAGQRDPYYLETNDTDFVNMSQYIRVLDGRSCHLLDLQTVPRPMAC